MRAERSSAANPRSLRSWGRAGIDAAFLLFIPAVWALALRGRPPDEDDDEESLAGALFKQLPSDLFGMLVGVRELAGMVEGFDYKGSAGLRWDLRERRESDQAGRAR